MEKKKKVHKGITRRSLLKAAGVAGIAAATSGTKAFFAPAIARGAAKGPIKIGHLAPQTGFLATCGEYMKKATYMARDEINAKGGVLGRKVEVITEDTVNPGVAVQKVTKLITKEKVDVLFGAVSSAVGLAVGDLAQRHKIPFINTSCNSDEIRGKRCHYYVFSVEGANTMYVNTIGRYLIKNRGFNKWYFLTSDYAFGHDLLRVSRRLLKEQGGTEVGSELIPTGSVDFSSYLLKVKAAKPDTVFQNLAGTDQTNFLKQYKEFGLDMTVAGGLIDTVLVWPVGLGNLTGVFPLLWWSDLPYKETQEWVAKFVKLYGKPPENIAWGDYVTMNIIVDAIAKSGTTNGKDLVEAMENLKIDGMKGRDLYFRNWDHQLMQPMYVAKAKAEKEAKDKWDIWEILAEVPGKDEPLEVIAATKEQNPCSMERA